MKTIDYSWDFTKEEFSLDLDFFNEKDQEDKMWQARTGLNHDTLCGAIETIIFMSDKPIDLQKIKNTIDTDLPLRVVHESITRLQEEYELKHHGIRLMEVAQGYQFRTKATFSSLIQKMFKVSSLQLSPTALEVLAIIAYKQPISKSAIETIRGVDSSHIVRGLMDKRLVRVVGRTEEVGKPAAYGTTPEFLEVFNLATLDDLPTQMELDELASASEQASISEIKDVVKVGDKKRFDFDELEELDQLSQSIKSIAADTIFTQKLKDEDKARKSAPADGPKKSAFDILEEYLDRKETIDQNIEAQNSELIMNALEPKQVDITQDIIFNAPEDDTDLSGEESQLLEEKRELPEASILTDEPVEEIESLFNQSELDREALSEALDDAFDNLFADEAESDEDRQANATMDEKLDEIDEITAKLSQQAKELDIDIDFDEERE